MPLDPRPRAGLRAGLLALALPCLLLAAPSVRADDAPAPAAPAAPAKAVDPLFIGTWPASVDCVVDADTIRLREAKQSIRIMAIDAEEVFHKDADREAAAKDFAAYAKAKRGDHPRPRKYGTPAGEAAREFVKQLMVGATAIRLERDHVDAPAKGTYGRLLGHVFIVSPEGTVNLAEAVIRAGHSPYFNKYGRSRRFDALFRKAQAEAREAKRGIWGETGPAHYPDYDERLAWWNARADQVDRWRTVADRPDHVTLGAPDANRKLAALVGKEAVVFGHFDRELPVKTGSQRVFLLTHERGRGFPFVIFDPKVAAALDMQALESRFVTLRGKITLYKERPQMVVESPTQVSTK